MGLFDWLRRLDKEEPAPASKKNRDEEQTEIYSGMRVEVTALDGRLLFVAKLTNMRGNEAELRQYSESSIPEDSEPLRVRIRGYNDHERKAVYLEGVIFPRPRHTWQVENLTIARIGNDRAFFRLDTDLEATATILFGPGAGEKPCRLLNISVGGACISSEYQYEEDAKFLLKVKLLEDRDISVMFCQILRASKKENGITEYGCRFLELSEADQAKITQNIFAVQRKQKRNI